MLNQEHRLTEIEECVARVIARQSTSADPDGRDERLLVALACGTPIPARDHERALEIQTTLVEYKDAFTRLGLELNGEVGEADFAMVCDAVGAYALDSG